MPPRDWQTLVSQMPPQQQLVHQTYRRDIADEEQRRAELVLLMVATYEDELTMQAQRSGNPDRAGRLTNATILAILEEKAREDAKSIVNTYNYDLALTIIAIATQHPDVGRLFYAQKLAEWEKKRAEKKEDIIALFTIGWATSRAQQDFYRFNKVEEGYAMLFPRTGVCPICLGWIARGRVPLHVAMNNPAPYHPNCPHYWSTKVEEFPPEYWALMWMGE